MTIREELGFTTVQKCELYVPSQDTTVEVAFDGRELAVDGVRLLMFARDSDPGPRALLYRTIESPDTPVSPHELRPNGTPFQPAHLLKRCKDLITPAFKKIVPVSPVAITLETGRGKLASPKIQHVQFTTGTIQEDKAPPDSSLQNMTKRELNNYVWAQRIKSAYFEFADIPFLEMNPNVTVLLSVLNRHEGRELSVAVMQELFTEATGIVMQQQEFIGVLRGFEAEYSKHEALTSRIRFRTVQGQGHFMWNRRRYA